MYISYLIQFNIFDFILVFESKYFKKSKAWSEIGESNPSHQFGKLR